MDSSSPPFVFRELTPAPDVSVAPLLGQPRRETVSDMCSLPRVYLAHRMPVFGTDAFEALLVAADLLGAGRASRMYRVLVRERQLAQDVTVFPFPVVGGASMFTLWATARPGIDPADLEAALVTEMDRLAADGPSEAELERVRNLHAAAVESSLERIAERADRLSMYACLFDGPERINTEVSRYLAVGPDRIRSAMAETLRPENRLSLTYLPQEAEGALEAPAEGVAS